MTLLAAYTLWQRELLRFYRQRSRVIGVLASPLLFWLVLGAGFGRSVQTAEQSDYLAYFFPGSVIMVVLFTSIFTMMSVIEDRREGFLAAVLVAPVSRASIVLGKVLGGATLAAFQGVLFLALGPLVGVHYTIENFVLALGIICLVALSLTALGFAVAWSLDSAQAFHAIINLFLIPLWLLSGALFPISSASGWIRALMFANPLTYGVEALRAALFSSAPVFAYSVSVAVIAGFFAILFITSCVIATKREIVPA